MKKAADVIMKCLEEQKLSQRTLASRMGEDVRYLNQQLNRQNDMKVERFDDVLQHLGYRLLVVDLGGVRKVCQEYAEEVIEKREPLGQFYTFAGGIWTGIDNSTGDAWTEDFRDFDEMMKWMRGEESVDASGTVHEV